MKKFSFSKTHQLFLTLLITVLFFTNCNIDRNSGNWSGKVTNQSECKDGSTKENAEFSTDRTYVTYKYNATENKLVLKHINTNFNCCSGDFSCTVNLEDNTLTITEEAEKADCDCMCLYDIDMEIDDIEVKAYTIKIVEPYIGDLEKISFNIDLANDTEGVFSLERDQYPWGM